MRRVALTGATGYVGRFIVADLHARGIAVRALTRQTSDHGGFARAPSWVEGDLTRPETFPALLDRCDALIHAGFQHVAGRYRGGEGEDLDGFLRANLHGSLALLAAARRAGIERCVLLSSRAAYGPPLPDRPLDESHPLRPDSFYGAHKAALEAFISAYARVEGWRACVLRPTGVYGLSHPVARSKWAGVIEAVLAKRAYPDARGGTEVHGADLARAVWALLTAGAPGEVYNCSDRYISDREVAVIAQRLSGKGGPLPDPPRAPPSGVMECTKLCRLGVRFGGEARLTATVAALLDALAG